MRRLDLTYLVAYHLMMTENYVWTVTSYGDPEMIKVVIENGRKWDFEDLPPKTIALDGAVEGPRVDAENERFSFDHHGGTCIRGITLSTCEQVRDFIRLGLDPSGYTVLLNHIDLDSALAAWELMYPDRVSDAMVDKLISVAGRQDAHAGGYPPSSTLSHAVLDFLAEPEKTLRGESAQVLTNDQMQFIMEAIWRRIEQYADGKLPQDLPDADDGYEVLRRGTGWKMVSLDGARSLRALAADNINKFVGISREIVDGESKSLEVTIGKRSEVVTGFPVGPAETPGTILNALNLEEPDREGQDDAWGGSTTIGGSPRNSDGVGTTLTEEHIFDIVEAVVTGTFKPSKRKRQTKSRSKASKE